MAKGRSAKSTPDDLPIIEGYEGTLSSDASYGAAGVGGDTPPVRYEDPDQYDDDDPDADIDDPVSHDFGDQSPIEMVSGADDDDDEDDDGPGTLSYLLPELRAAARPPEQPAAGGMTIKRIIQEPGERRADSRTQIDDRKLRDRPYRHIVAFRIKGNGPDQIGTGWMAGPNIIVTAGHNLCNNHKLGRGWVHSLTVRGTGFDSFTINNPQAVSHVPKDWRESKAQTSDWGIIRLNHNLGTTIGFFALKAWDAGDLLRIKNFNVVGYPAEKAWQMWAHIGQIIKDGVRLRTLRYRMDATGGQSGAPIIAWSGDRENGRMYVVGIHAYGKSGYNQATRITQPIIDKVEEFRQRT